MIALDHLVVGTDRLDKGAAELRERLGVDFDAGGRHEGWGTHNRLLSLGPSTYLELIAADPEQPEPAGARAFGLDAPEVRARIAERPRLLAYVVRTDDIDAARRLLGLPAGEVLAMRRGALAWRLSRPAPGQPAGTPSLIDWGDSPRPAQTLPARGLELARLRIAVPAATAAMLAPLADDPRILVETAPAFALEATIATAAGPVRLD